MNIAVLCAGLSTERAISVKTGYNVCKALREKGHNAVLVDAYFGHTDPNIFENSAKEYDIDVDDLEILAEKVAYGNTSLIEKLSLLKKKEK